MTYCENCKHVYRERKNDTPYKWLCIKHKRAEGFAFVTRTSWDGDPPYGYCRIMNLGHCPLYEEAPPEQHIKPEE